MSRDDIEKHHTIITTFLYLFYELCLGIRANVLMKKTVLNNKSRYFEKGKKGIGEWVLRLNLPKKTAPSYVELGVWVAWMAANEERMYPREKGFLGKDMFRNYLNDVIDAGFITESIKNKYHLK